MHLTLFFALTSFDSTSRPGNFDFVLHNFGLLSFARCGVPLPILLRCAPRQLFVPAARRALPTKIKDDANFFDRPTLRLGIHEVREDEVEGQNADVHGVAATIRRQPTAVVQETYYLH